MPLPDPVLIWQIRVNDDRTVLWANLKKLVYNAVKDEGLVVVIENANRGI